MRTADAIQLHMGPLFAPTLWDVRKQVSAARKGGDGLLFVTLVAPILSQEVMVAIDSGSLYLVGIRAAAGRWLEFAPDTAQSSPGRTALGPRLPGSKWIMAGSGRALFSYGALRLDWNISRKDGSVGKVVYGSQPIDLLNFFSRWDGQIAGYHHRVNLCVLIFAVCEALRFRSIENAVSGWVGGITSVRWTPTLAITKEMLDTVQNWHSLALRNDPDVWTWPPEMPDLLIN